MNKKGLGRGLSVLIPDTEVSKSENEIVYIDINNIKPNINQPRKRIDSNSINELASSIKEKGIIQPIIVRKKGNEYEIITGERRWRAAKIAGKTEIPAIVKDLADNETLEIALIENIQREDLNPLEIAECYKLLMEKENITQEELAQKVGKDRATISNFVRLLKLPEEVKAMIASGELSTGHAKLLVGLDEKRAINLSHMIIRNSLSVREVEKLLTKKVKSRNIFEKKRKTKDVEIRDIEEKLIEKFGTKVIIKTGTKKGFIQIEFYSPKELERILEILM